MKKLKAYSSRPWYFVLPYLVLCAIFIIIPLIILFFQMFRGPDGGFSLEGFKVLASAKNYQILFQSLGVALLNTVLCLLISYPLAYFLSRAPFKRMTVLVLMFLIPMWINFLLRMYALKTVFDIFLIDLGFAPMMCGLVYDFFPFMLMPIYTSLSGMNKMYREASLDLGASPVRTFFTVTLPMSVPGIVSGALMVFMPTLSAFAVTNMFGDTFMIFGDLINKYFMDYPTFSAGAVLAFVLLLMVIASTVAGNLVGGKHKKAEVKK